MSHHHKNSSTYSNRKHSRSHKNDTNCSSSAYHYHRESKKNPHLSDIDRNWEKMEKYRERKMTLMKIHKVNVEFRMKENNKNLYLHRPIHPKTLKYEGRKTSLDPNWYTENIYSNQSIDNSDEEKKRKHILSDLNGNEEESDILFTVDPKPHGVQRYPKSNSCCFATSSIQPQISKSHSFCTTRGSKYDFLKFTENSVNNRNDNHSNKPLLNKSKPYKYLVRSSSGGIDENDMRYIRTCDREGCVNDICFAKELKPARYNKADYFSQFNETSILNENNCFNDVDIFSFDDDESLEYVGNGTICCNKQQRLKKEVDDNGLDKLYKTEILKDILRNNLDQLNQCTDDFTDHYNGSCDNLLHVTEYTSPNVCLGMKPKKYDDSDSESANTDTDLDDFSYDLKKYWKQLEKNDDVDINQNMLSAEENSLSKFDHFNKNDFDFLRADDPYSRFVTKKRSSSLCDNFPFSSSPYHQRYIGLQNRDHNDLNLLNDLFSMHKPNKYSPLNCHQSEKTKNNRLKSQKVTKINALSSTRPLGLPRSPSIPPYLSSGTRPLVIYNYDKSALLSELSSTMDRPRFQIIPHKTGVKVTPLYRLKYDHDLSGKHKCKLKSTTRPLAFW